jgi:acyl-CoA reductase-like NAD-dependent aldehyde dehydrogenase
VLPFRAGTVAVNGYSEGDITTPFGGYRQSGFGGRDNGLEAAELAGRTPAACRQLARRARQSIRAGSFDTGRWRA